MAEIARPSHSGESTATTSGPTRSERPQGPIISSVDLSMFNGNPNIARSRAAIRRGSTK